MPLKKEKPFNQRFYQSSMNWAGALGLSESVCGLLSCVLWAPQLAECADGTVIVGTDPSDYARLFTPNLFSIMDGGLLIATLILLGGLIIIILRKRKIKKRLVVIENDLAKQVVEVSRTETTGRMSASLAHDLKQPITAILLNAQGALRLLKRSELCLSDLEENLNDIVSDVTRLNKIVVGLSGLVLTKKSKRETLDLNHEVKDVLDLLAGEILKNGVRLVAELTDTAQPIAWKRGELRHVIIILVLNALDNMIGCNKERCVIAIKTEMNESSIELSVQDFGDTTALDVIPHLNNFSQAVKVSNSPNNDMGALSYCAYVVESHQGTIEALSPTGIGCLIRITLPIISVPL